MGLGGIKPTPDGKTWAAIVGNLEINHQLILGGFEKHRLVVHSKVPLYDFPLFFVWHPDGESLFVANRRGTVDLFRLQ